MVAELRHTILPKGAAIGTTSTTEIAETGQSVESNNQKFFYIQAHAALTAFAPYVLTHNGIDLKSAAPATASFIQYIGVPQQAIASGDFGWVQVEGDATMALDTSAIVVGSPIEVINAGTTGILDASYSGQTVAVAKAANGGVAGNYSVYLRGIPVVIAAA